VVTLEACHCPGSAPAVPAPYAVHGATLPACGTCRKPTRYAARIAQTGAHVCRPCARRLLGDPDAR
jgi:hypothetical protein